MDFTLHKKYCRFFVFCNIFFFTILYQFWLPSAETEIYSKYLKSILVLQHFSHYRTYQYSLFWCTPGASAAIWKKSPNWERFIMVSAFQLVIIFPLTIFCIRITVHCSIFDQQCRIFIMIFNSFTRKFRACMLFICHLPYAAKNLHIYNSEFSE